MQLAVMFRSPERSANCQLTSASPQEGWYPHRGQKTVLGLLGLVWHVYLEQKRSFETPVAVALALTLLACQDFCHAMAAVPAPVPTPPACHPHRQPFCSQVLHEGSVFARTFFFTLHQGCSVMTQTCFNDVLNTVCRSKDPSPACARRPS